VNWIDRTRSLRTDATDPLVASTDLWVEYKTRGRRTRGLDGVSLSIEAGESVGLMGESGSGKSTLARTLVGLNKPVRGTVKIQGVDVYSLPPRRRHRSFGREVAFVFQDPRSSLNPRLSVGAVVREPLRVHKIGDSSAQQARVHSLLESVGLPPQVARRSVRALSGGQLQRVALARALAVDPKLIIADEPTSALDVSVQAQIIELIQDLRARQRLALLIISHDIRVVRCLTDRAAVMCDGVIVESGSTEDLYRLPRHDYTKQLLSSVPLLSRL
jgi:ABC-type glutathione transport system ATPase component